MTEFILLTKYFCFFLLRVCEGIKNGVIYQEQLNYNKSHRLLNWFSENIHRVEYISLYALCFLALSLALQIELHIKESFVRHISLYIFSYYIAEPFRQWFINEGTGLPEEEYKTVSIFGIKTDLLRLNIKQKSIVAVISFILFAVTMVYIK